MITEDYVSFEVAKLLKERGFDWECIGYYVDYEPNDVKYSFLGETNSTWESRCCSAPTLQMAMKWLRERHCIVTIEPLWFHADGKCNGWTFNIWADDNLEVDAEDHLYLSSTYKEACEAAIKYCLENLI